mgnify:CR=1 FL=1
MCIRDSNGAIVTGPERWHLVADKLLGAQVPPTLTGVLQARVDSLPPREKLTLQQASVIGVAFWDQALAAIAVSYTHLRAHETVLDLVCRLLLEKKKSKKSTYVTRNHSTSPTTIYNRWRTP